MSKMYNLTLSGIFETELYSHPPLMWVVVAEINGDKQVIPEVFKLTRDASTADLKHLRRIKDLNDGRMECIVCSIRGTNNGNSTVKLIDVQERYESTGILKNFRLLQVPSKAPRTDHQWRVCSQLWPCKYAKSNYLIKCMQGSVFSDVDRKVVEIIVRNLLDLIQCKENSFSSGAVIFKGNQVHGFACTSSDIIKSNPTKHAVMVAIDAVAEKMGFGHWRDHGEQKEIFDELLKLDINVETDSSPYLCTDYDIIVTEEPCLMCSMALVQSRIRRLFFLSSESFDKVRELERLCYKDGAIEKLFVHRDKNLNHRFEAWRINISIGVDD